MKHQLINTYLKENTNFKPFIVGIDNKKEMSDIYKELDKVTNNNWTYCIDMMNIKDAEYNCAISLFVPGRVMPGVGTSHSGSKEALEEAIKQSVSMLYPYTPEEGVSDTKETKQDVIKEDKEQTQTLEEIDKIESSEDALTFDEIDAQEQREANEIKSEEQSDDNELAMEGNTITKGQVRFINDFKKVNQIDSDEKFNYYIKTWASNKAIVDIDNKTKLIQAGYEMLENFIQWIKIMQPTLDKGIVSPL